MRECKQNPLSLTSVKILSLSFIIPSLSTLLIPETPLTTTQGVCKGSSLGKEVKSWIDDHKALVIGVAAAVGGLILFSILGCIYRCFKRRRNMKRYGRPYAVPPPRWNGPRGPRSPYGSQGPLFPQQNAAWYEGPGGQPLPPPPAYRQNSVRYA